MTRDEAVVRIQDGLGFASRQSDKIILRLQEAQRDLEKGKTLPRFLLKEQVAPLLLLEGQSLVALPVDFLRMDDNNPPHYTVASTGEPFFISMKNSYRDALEANFSSDPVGPKVGVILLAPRRITFINPADKDYTILWSYYAAADLLTTNIENAWLANAPEWLIGEAGWRMAMDARDKEAAANFQQLLTRGRAACFGEIIASEDASGPLIMGANL
jgi:hypothetical protein